MSEQEAAANGQTQEQTEADEKKQTDQEGEQNAEAEQNAESEQHNAEGEQTTEGGEQEAAAADDAQTEETKEEDAQQEEVKEEETTQEETTQEETTQEETAQEATQEETPQEETAQEETPQEETTQEETSQEETAQEETPQEEATQEEATQEETTQEETPQENGQQEETQETEQAGEDIGEAPLENGEADNIADLNLSEEVVAKLNRMFQVHAENDRIDFSQFKRLLRLAEQNFTNGEAQDIFDRGDLDDNGTINFKEFCTLYSNNMIEVDKQEEVIMECIAKVFPGDSRLPLGKVTKIMTQLDREGSCLNEDDVSSLVQTMDKNGDGMIDRLEFARILVRREPSNL